MTYTPTETVQYENLVKFCYREAAQGYVFPDDVMLSVDICAVYPIPKGTSKKKTIDMLNKKIRPTKKPDTDNIAKVICDSLNMIAYHDDAVVVDLSVSKYYGEIPEVRVKIKEATGTDISKSEEV